MSTEAAHATLSAAARVLACVDSKLVKTVSRHVLSATVSFSNVAALLAAAKAATTGSSNSKPPKMFLGSSGSQLVFSAHFPSAPPPPPPPPPTTPAPAPALAPPPPVATTTLSSSGKRRRDLAEDQAEGASRARKRLQTSVGSQSAVTSQHLDVAQRVVNDVLQLRGPLGEVAVLSYAMLTRKLGADPDPSLIVAFRINGGVPLSVLSLKRALGACWRDGAISTEDAVRGVCERDLPLTEEAASSARLGNKPILIVTSVPTCV
jgi:type IV secretory pathway VirB10-like protein